ncbi:MAG: isocitrate dehydrogenase, partial [Acidiferrobacterales bacterium]
MKKRLITVIPGDGIGPEIMRATLKILDHLDCGLEYEFADAGISALKKSKELLPAETERLIAKNRIVFKGPLTTPVGEGFTSLNVTLRKRFDLYANLRPAISYPGTTSRYENIDIITIRENTEGMYAGEGQEISPDGERAESISVVTRLGAEKILRFAYETARLHKRKQVTVVHKANILKATSALFLRVSREMAKEYSDITTNEMIVDNACMQLVMNPYQFDVIATTNLFGDIISDLCAGLIGGLGMAPGANIGDDMAMFEAVHGSAPDIAGKKIANPSALMLAAALMLEHLHMGDKAKQIRQAIRATIESKDRCTADLGGQGSTAECTQAIVE